MNRLLLLTLLFLSGCTGYTRGRKLTALTHRDTTVILHPAPTDSVRFYYSGCAGFFIRRGPDALLNDPFLSNNGSLTALLFRRLVPDSARLAGYVERILGKPVDTAGVVKFLTATHTHSDHVYDVPTLYHRYLRRDSLRLVGSESFRRLMRASAAEYNQPLGPLMMVDSLRSSADTLREWVYADNRRLRVLPLYSYHAPHFYGIKFYKGNIRPNLRRLPDRTNDYREGQCLAYLVDFLNAQEQPDFRVYLQGSASKDSLGFPPSLPDGKAVDVAVLCVASFAYVRRHPEAILDRLRPRFVMLSHWENFFQPGRRVEAQPAVVPFSSAKKFLRRFRRRMRAQGNPTGWTMPMPGTWTTVRF